MRIINLVCVFIVLNLVGCKSWWKNDKEIINNAYVDTNKTINVEKETSSIRQNSNDIIKISKDAKDNSVKLAVIRPELTKIQEYMKLDANVDDICKIGTELKINTDNLEIKKNVINDFSKQVVEDINKYALEVNKYKEQVVTLQKELKESENSKSTWIFGWMIAIGAIVSGLGIFIALQCNPKTGISIVIAGVATVATGMMFKTIAIYLPWIALISLICGIIYVIKNKMTAIEELVEGFERLKPKLTQEVRDISKDIFGAVQSQSTVEQVNEVRKEITNNIVSGKINNPTSIDNIKI